MSGECHPALETTPASSRRLLGSAASALAPSPPPQPGSRVPPLGAAIPSSMRGLPQVQVATVPDLPTTAAVGELDSRCHAMETRLAAAEERLRCVEGLCAKQSDGAAAAAAVAAGAEEAARFQAAAQLQLQELHNLCANELAVLRTRIEEAVGSLDSTDFSGGARAAEIEELVVSHMDAVRRAITEVAGVQEELCGRVQQLEEQKGPHGDGVANAGSGDGGEGGSGGTAAGSGEEGGLSAAEQLRALQGQFTSVNERMARVEEQQHAAMVAVEEATAAAVAASASAAPSTTTSSKLWEGEPEEKQLQALREQLLSLSMRVSDLAISSDGQALQRLSEECRTEIDRHVQNVRRLEQALSHVTASGKATLDQVKGQQSSLEQRVTTMQQAVQDLHYRIASVDTVRTADFGPVPATAVPASAAATPLGGSACFTGPALADAHQRLRVYQSLDADARVPSSDAVGARTYLGAAGRDLLPGGTASPDAEHWSSSKAQARPLQSNDLSRVTTPVELDARSATKGFDGRSPVVAGAAPQYTVPGSAQGLTIRGGVGSPMAKAPGVPAKGGQDDTCMPM